MINIEEISKQGTNIRNGFKNTKLCMPYEPQKCPFLSRFPRNTPTVFDQRRVKRRRFITFMNYDLVYLSIASNLITSTTLNAWYDFVCTHTCSPFSRNPLLGWYRTIKTWLLINLYLELTSFVSYQPHSLFT